MQAVGVEARMGLPAWTGEEGFGVVESPTRAQFGFDVIVLKLLMHRQVPAQMRIAQALGQKIVVDVDDFYADLPESNMAFRATDPAANRITNRDHYLSIIRQADRVTVTTPFLKTHYSQFHDDVIMVRNGILPEQFTVRPVRDRKPVIGWVGGIPWRGGDLETLRAWLPDFLEQHDLMFHHAGHADSIPGLDERVPSFADVVGIPAHRMTTSPLKTIDKYHELFSFDIGLIPLNDIPFNHAKSNLKGLEYSAAGIPFVAQDLPEYQRLHDLGVGRVARGPEDWAREVGALLDYRTRKKDARVNRERVVKNESIMARESDWRDALLRWD
jgi:hypothetical protein